MVKVEGPGSSGKTKQLMTLASENNGYFVCHNPRAMEEKALAYEIIRLNIISYEDYDNGNYDTSKPVYMDEPKASYEELEQKGVAGIAVTIK